MIIKKRIWQSDDVLNRLIDLDDISGFDCGGVILAGNFMMSLTNDELKELKSAWVDRVCSFEPS